MNNNMQSYAEELNQGITFSFGRTTQHELAVNYSYRIKRFEGTSTGSNNELNEYFKKIGIFTHRCYKPSDAPSMDDYFGDFQGQGTNWERNENYPISLDFQMERNAQLYEEPSCDCHLPIGYSQNKHFVRCSAVKVAEKFAAISQVIDDAVKEQNPTCYYATRGCADESGNYDEEYGEACTIMIFPSEVIAFWSESYFHYGPIYPANPPIHKVDPKWESKLSYWFFDH